MLVSLTVGKVDAGVTVLLTPDKRLIEFPSILLPPDISSGSIVDITVSQNLEKEAAAERAFRELQERIFTSFGASAPATPVLRCRNATQTSVVLEWDPIELATADLLSLSLYRNGQKAGNIPRPLQMHSTKISGLAVDTAYTFHLVLKTSAGTFSSERVEVSTHKMTDLSGVTITTGILPASAREHLEEAVAQIGAKIVEGVRIDTTHFVTTEGRGQAWEKAVESNIPVVRPEWVDACREHGRILGVAKFYLDAARPGLAEGSQSQASPRPSVAPAQRELPPVPPPAAEDETKASQDEEEAGQQYAPLEAEGDKKEGGDDESSSEDGGSEDGQSSEHKSRQADAEEEGEESAAAAAAKPAAPAEEVDEQTLPVRPAEQAPQVTADEVKHSDDEGKDGGQSDASEAAVEGKKEAATPDGSASFQDVAL